MSESSYSSNLEPKLKPTCTVINETLFISLLLTSCSVGNIHVYDYQTTIELSLVDGETYDFSDSMFIGELSLSGEIRRVSGILPCAICAKENNIAHQFEILTYGGTDAGAMQTVKSGAMTGAISLPLRYVHTPCETANKKDIEACIKLVSEFCIKDFILS